MTVGCSNATKKQSSSYAEIKEKVLKGSKEIPTSLSTAEKQIFIDEFSKKLKNDEDFKTTYLELKKSFLGKVVTRKDSSSSFNKKKFVLAMLVIQKKFPEINKLDKETRAEIMRKAGDTLTKEDKKRLREEMLRRLADRKTDN